MVVSFRIFADGFPQAAAAIVPVLHQHRMCVFFRVIDGVPAVLPLSCFRGAAYICRIKRIGAGITAFFDFVQITASFSSLLLRHRSISFWHWCIHYKTLVDVFGGSGIITLNTAVPKGCLQIYNDLNHDLYNLLFCVKHRPMALTKELSFLPINARDEFDVLRRQLQGEDFTQLYLDEELQLAEQMFPPPEAEEVKRLLQSRAELSDVRRAAAIYKLQRYSYNGNGDSYGVSSCDIQRFFRDIWECSHRLKDVALENKDFESIITTHNDPQTTVYCDPPYYEAERYAVEFPRSDHQRLHDVLAQHTGFAMVSYNNCDYIRRLYEDFFIYEVERPNSQSKKKNDIYREYIMTNYDPRVFASQMTIFGDYSSDGKICRLVHIPERPLRT